MKCGEKRTAEGNQYAERFCVVFGAIPRFHGFQDPNHDCQNDDLADGGYCE